MAQDAMLKAADVQLLLARTICSGKYLIVIGGEVAAVSASWRRAPGAATGRSSRNVSFAQVHQDVFPAIGLSVDVPTTAPWALASSRRSRRRASSTLADACAKSADVHALRIHLAMALGGKGFVLLTGSVRVSKRRSPRHAGRGEDGILVGRAVIAAPSKETVREFV